MSGCQKGPGRDKGPEIEFENDPECDECTRMSRECRGWQKTPKFHKYVPARHKDPCTQQTLGKVRLVVGSTIGTVLVGGWLYHQYLHFMTAKEAEKDKKKAAKRLKNMQNVHVKKRGSNTPIVAPMYPDMGKAEIDKKAVGSIDKLEENSKVTSYDTIEVGEGTKNTVESRKSGDMKVFRPTPGSSPNVGVKGDPARAPKQIIMNDTLGSSSKEVQHEHFVTTGKSSKPEIKNSHVTVWISKQLKNKHSNASTSENTSISDLKSAKNVVNNDKQFNHGNSKIYSYSYAPGKTLRREVPKKGEPIGNSKDTKHHDVKITPSAILKPKEEIAEQSTVTKIEYKNVSQNEEKFKPGQIAGFSVYTEGKTGNNVKRRGWK